MSSMYTYGIGPYSFLMLTEIVLLRFERTNCHQCAIVVIFGLKRADCADKSLVTVPRSLPTEINVLTFNGNLLSKLEMDEFRHYHSLQEITLVRNQVGVVAPDAFRGLHNLQILDLEANQLTGVPNNAFQHLPSLRILSLKTNPIKFLTHDCFKDLVNIEVLNLENCWLQRVHPHAFRGLHKLIELNVVNNELHGLSEAMSEHLPHSLSIVRLHRNPWNCDCRLRWLRRRLTTKSINWDFASNSPVCVEPKLLSDIPWKHLGWERFACPSVIVNTVTSIRVQIGANATVDCIAVGDPEPQITWTHNARRMARSTFTLTTESNHLGDRQVRSTIAIQNATRRDTGDYKCTAENSAGRSEVTYKVWLHEEETIVIVGNFSKGVIRRDDVILLSASAGSLLLFSFVILAVVLLVRRKRTKYQAYKVHSLQTGKKGGVDSGEDSRLQDAAENAPENRLLTNTGSSSHIESPGDDWDTSLTPLHYRSPPEGRKQSADGGQSEAGETSSRCIQKWFGRLKDRRSKDFLPPQSSPIDVWFIKTENGGGGGGQCEFTPDILRCESAPRDPQSSSLQNDTDCLPTIPEDDDIDDDVITSRLNDDVTAFRSFKMTIDRKETMTAATHDRVKRFGKQHPSDENPAIVPLESVSMTTVSNVKDFTKRTDEATTTTPGTSDLRPGAAVPTLPRRKDSVIAVEKNVSEPDRVDKTNSTGWTGSPPPPKNIDLRARECDRTELSGTVDRWSNQTQSRPGENRETTNEDSWGRETRVAPGDKTPKARDFQKAGHVPAINSGRTKDEGGGGGSARRRDSCQGSEGEIRITRSGTVHKPKPGQRDEFGTTV